MAELILLRPIFAGTDHIDQLRKIFDIVGTLDLETLDEIYEPRMENYRYWLRKIWEKSYKCILDARDYIHQLVAIPKQDYTK